MATKVIIPDIFEHDIGTHFQAEIKNLVNAATPAALDISAATEKLIIFILPDETEVEYSGEFVTDGEDGLLEYVTEDREVLVKITDEPFETWQYYAWVAYPGGERGSSKVKFRLYKGRKSLNAPE